MLPTWLASRLRDIELDIKEKIYWNGPGGFDDGIVEDLTRYREVYAPLYAHRLMTADRGSKRELNALHHIALYLDSPQVRAVVTEFSNSKASEALRENALRLLKDSDLR